jgi:hypothetical protein
VKLSARRGCPRRWISEPQSRRSPSAAMGREDSLAVAGVAIGSSRPLPVSGGAMKAAGTRPFVTHVDQSPERAVEASNCPMFTLQARSVTEQQEHSYMILDRDQWKRSLNKDRPYLCMWHSMFGYPLQYYLRLKFYSHLGGIQCTRHYRPPATRLLPVMWCFPVRSDWGESRHNLKGPLRTQLPIPRYAKSHS